MPKSFLVEVVVCECGADGKRWTAHGQIVGEFPTMDEAAVVSARLVAEAARESKD